MDSIPSRGEYKYPELLSVTKPGISFGMMGYLARRQVLCRLKAVNNSLRNSKTQPTFLGE